MTSTVTSISYASPLGRLTLVASGAGLRAVLWQKDDPARAGLAGAELGEPGASPVLTEACRQLDGYFAGTRTRFELPLDLEGTPFQQQAWRALAEIPFGETRTYAEQARRLGRPNAFRAVGAANGRNPLSIVLPCHRVVGSDGSLTGFAGGLDAKRWLLEHEQRQPADPRGERVLHGYERDRGAGVGRLREASAHERREGSQGTVGSRLQGFSRFGIPTRES